jgi:5-dehydro-2-deoxygluconokinase
MSSLGYSRPLYVLPFDHRHSFELKMFGLNEPLSAEETAEISAAKEVIYDGFRAAIEGGVPKQSAGILVDEQFGAEILRDATVRGYITAYPVEKSGHAELELEFGDHLAEHIESFRPTFCKVLVRYNPEGDPTLNERQATLLRRLSSYLRTRSASRFMFELLVPPSASQLERLAGNEQMYDATVRPVLMVSAIHELQERGVEPDVWKVEGLDRREDCERIVAAARRDGRDEVGCIVLGRGESEEKVCTWLAVASTVPGFIGFAVGRTTFWIPLREYRAGHMSREDAVLAIAVRYRKFVDLFEAHRPAKSSAA